jgi:hypothetical protein
MGLKTEEDIDAWFSVEKERISEEFMNSITKDRDNTPKYKARFDAGMKKILAQYNKEYSRILSRIKAKKKIEES